MKITPDDPRLTAYVLEEDGAERAGIALALADSEECRREVEEIVRVVEILRAEFAVDAPLALTAAQGAAIDAALHEGRIDRGHSNGRGGRGGGDGERVPSKRRLTRPRAFAAALAASALIGVGIYFVVWGRSNPAYASTIEQIETAKSITWTKTAWVRIRSKDGSTRWLSKGSSTMMAFKPPGIYREWEEDAKGNITSVVITDTQHMREMTLDGVKKVATLTELTMPHYDGRGPWTEKKSMLESNQLQWAETRGGPAGPVNIFRFATKWGNEQKPWSYEFWIDQKTKQLREVRTPGGDIFDPSTDPARNNPPGKGPSSIDAYAWIDHDIVFNADLDDAFFKLEPPPGYAVERGAPAAHVTEREMADYLGILADANGKQFPDDVISAAPPYEMTVRIGTMKKEERTPAEQKFEETVQHYSDLGLIAMPITHFTAENAVQGSFRYLGTRVKLGDKERIVCWYKLKGAATYRVIYGDLTVKDLAAEALPLPVAP